MLQRLISSSVSCGFEGPPGVESTWVWLRFPFCNLFASSQTAVFHDPAHSMESFLFYGNWYLVSKFRTAGLLKRSPNIAKENSSNLSCSLLVPFSLFPASPLSLEKAMAPHSSTLAWKIPWMEEPGRLQSMGSLGVARDWATSLSLLTFMHWRRKWQPTPVFLPGESQGQGSLLGCCLWGRTESDTTAAT